MLEIQRFIQQNENWEEKLQQKPYCLLIKEDGNLVLFKYNQIDSKMNKRICQEARGLILEKNTWKVVRCAFFKFFNYGESNAADIDFDSAKVQEKVDGSLISLYYYNGWQVATNGTINAKDAFLQFQNDKYETYYDLFSKASENINLNSLNKNYTYTFELTSKYNKVVIPHGEPKLTHIATRDNITLEELDEDIGVEKPKSYKFSSVEDIIESAKKLPYNEEGYVIVDRNWNRLKVKSPAYVAIHHMKENGKMSNSKMIRLVMKGEKEEFLTYFSEYKEDFEKVEKLFNQYVSKLKKDLKDAQRSKFNNRSSFAKWAKDRKSPHMLFMWYDHKISTVEEYISLLDEKKLQNVL